MCKPLFRVQNNDICHIYQYPTIITLNNYLNLYFSNDILLTFSVFKKGINCMSVKKKKEAIEKAISFYYKQSSNSGLKI